MSKLLIPNTCQVPNVLLDVVMRRISDPALRVLLAVVRKTYGFQKQSDHISLTQLQEITGLSRQGVVNGTNALDTLLIVHRHGKRQGNEYSLNLDIETGQLVNAVDQSTRLTSQRSAKLTSQRGRHTKPNKNKTHIPSVFSSTENVIRRLNELTGQCYRPGSKATKKHIGARIAEGFSEADLLVVVEDRCARWRDDPKMREYLRPSTLFNSEKFEAYLQVARANGAGARQTSARPEMPA